MKIYAKYEFLELPKILTSEEGIDGASVVIVGKMVKQEGTYDKQGNEITAPVISDKIAVDVIYESEVLPELEPYRIYPVTPDHTISGMEWLYFESIK